MGVMEVIFGDLNKKEVKKLDKIADKVESYDEAMQALTDEELRAKTAEFQERCQNKGESLDSLLPEAFRGLPGSGVPRPGHEAFPRADHRRHRAASGTYRRDEDR